MSHIAGGHRPPLQSEASEVTQFLKRRNSIWLRPRAALIVIEKVPAGVCTQCGERVVNADTGKQIAILLKDSQHLSAARKAARAHQSEKSRMNCCRNATAGRAPRERE